MSDVTQILSQIEAGDPSAAEQLLPLVYDELRKLAAARLAQEKPGQTLQATALVHDAFIRLVDVEKVQHWNSRGHFFGAAAEAMRRILVELRLQVGQVGMPSIMAGIGTMRKSPADALAGLAGNRCTANQFCRYRLFHPGQEVAIKKLSRN